MYVTPSSAASAAVGSRDRHRARLSKMGNIRRFIGFLLGGRAAPEILVPLEGFPTEKEA